MLNKAKKNNKGFTLIELMVSVSIFVIVMVISTGSILSVFDANRKSQTLRTVMDNLNLTMESMTRVIRFGTNYHCDVTVTNPALTSPRDCGSGASSIQVLASDGVTRVAYRLVNNKITRSINGGTEYDLTSADMVITDLSFRVFGSPLYANGTDKFQPQVIIVIRGYAGTKVSTRSEFTLQTTVSQRAFDFQ